MVWQRGEGHAITVPDSRTLHPSGQRNQLQWMNFPFVWQRRPSGLMNREPSPVSL